MIAITRARHADHETADGVHASLELGLGEHAGSRFRPAPFEEMPDADPDRCAQDEEADERRDRDEHDLERDLDRHGEVRQLGHGRHGSDTRRVPWSVGRQYFRGLRFRGILTLGCGPAAPLSAALTHGACRHRRKEQPDDLEPATPRVPPAMVLGR